MTPPNASSDRFRTDASPSPSSRSVPAEEPPYFVADAGDSGTEIVVPDEILRAERRFERPARAVPSVVAAEKISEKRAAFANVAKKSGGNGGNRENGSASVAAAAPSWTRLLENELASIWLEATRGLGCALSAQAAEFCAIRVEAPNSFVVYFPGDRRIQRDFCEREKSKIVANLVGKLGGAVVLRCLLDAARQATDASNWSNSASPASRSNSSNPSNRDDRSFDAASESGGSFGRSSTSNGVAPSAPRENFRDVYRKIERNEVVRQIKELFDAELAEVKPPEKAR